MILDIELTEEEMSNINNGGFYVLILHDGVKVIVTKDQTKTED